MIRSVPEQRFSLNPINAHPIGMDGLLFIDKDPGVTSHDVVAQVRNILSIKSVGHAGTLDPIASGLLVLLVGQATKLSDYILMGDKGYRFTVKLGVETDTLDVTGKIVREFPVNLSKTDVYAEAVKLVGELELRVPRFSAIKVQGKTLHREARKGLEFTPPLRKMNFYDLCCVDYDQDFSSLTVEVRCGKGAYIRSWAQELGNRLGVGACVQELRRVFSSPYEVQRAIHLKDLQQMERTGLDHLESAYIPLASTLEDWPSLVVEGTDQTKLRNGQLSMGIRSRLRALGERTWAQSKGIKIMTKDENQKNLLALLQAGNIEGEYKIARVFHSFRQ